MNNRPFFVAPASTSIVDTVLSYVGDEKFLVGALVALVGMFVFLETCLTFFALNVLVWVLVISPK